MAFTDFFSDRNKPEPVIDDDDDRLEQCGEHFNK